jgi:hypothetical protein
MGVPGIRYVRVFDHLLKCFSFEKFFFALFAELVILVTLSTI